MKIRQPMHPFIQNTLILVTSGVVASLLCAKVYAATLPVEEPAASAPIVAAQQAPASVATTDAQAAAQLRALLLGQRQLHGTSGMVGTASR